MNTSVSDRARHLFKPVRVPIFRRVPLWIALPVVVISLLSGYQELARGDVGSVVASALVVGCILLAFGLVWVIVTSARRTTALAIEGDRLVYESWGRTRSWPLLDIAKVVQGDVLVETLGTAGYSTQNLLFMSRSGHCFLRLGHQWDHARIAHAIGLAIQPIDAGVLTAGDAARLYPGSFNWWLAHPWGRAGVGYAIGVVAIIAIMLFITWRG